MASLVVARSSGRRVYPDSVLFSGLRLFMFAGDLSHIGHQGTAFQLHSATSVASAEALLLRRMLSRHQPHRLGGIRLCVAAILGFSLESLNQKPWRAPSVHTHGFLGAAPSHIWVQSKCGCACCAKGGGPRLRPSPSWSLLSCY